MYCAILHKIDYQIQEWPIISDEQETRMGEPGTFGQIFYYLGHAVKVVPKKLVKQMEITFSRLNLKGMMQVPQIYHFEGKLMMFCIRYQGSLTSLIKNGYFQNSANQIDFLIQMVELLNTLKAHNVVHYDLKPANILFNFKGPRAILSLCDFGSICVMCEKECTNSCIRGYGYTLHFAAPVCLN
jgi:serine/threonine protein kinase